MKTTCGGISHRVDQHRRTGLSRRDRTSGWRYVLDTALTATLRWTYWLNASSHHPASKTHLIVSSHEDASSPIVDVMLPEDVTTYRLAVVPRTTYFWQAIPIDGSTPQNDSIIRGRFTSGVPRIDTTDDDRIRYRNAQGKASLDRRDAGSVRSARASIALVQSQGLHRPGDTDVR